MSNTLYAIRTIIAGEKHYWAAGVGTFVDRPGGGSGGPGSHGLGLAPEQARILEEVASDRRTLISLEKAPDACWLGDWYRVSGITDPFLVPSTPTEAPRCLMLAARKIESYRKQGPFVECVAVTYDIVRDIEVRVAERLPAEDHVLTDGETAEMDRFMAVRKNSYFDIKSTPGYDANPEFVENYLKSNGREMHDDLVLPMFIKMNPSDSELTTYKPIAQTFMSRATNLRTKREDRIWLEVHMPGKPREYIDRSLDLVYSIIADGGK